MVWRPGVEGDEEGARGNQTAEDAEGGDLRGGELGASPHGEDYRSFVEGRASIKWWGYELIFCGWVGGYGDVGGGGSGGSARGFGETG